MGTIIPLLKASNIDKSSLSSFRPITRSSLFGKVIDLLVVSRYQEAFCSSDLQLSFKSRHSTNHCTFFAKEATVYYVNNGSDDFACAIDMQKAFNRVDLIELFQKLSQKPIPAFYYTYFIPSHNVDLHVMWNGAYSSSFSSINGVRQGEILSPFLFSIFINDLKLELDLNREGCFVGQIFSRMYCVRGRHTHHGHCVAC